MSVPEEDAYTQWKINFTIETILRQQREAMPRCKTCNAYRDIHWPLGPVGADHPFAESRP